MGFSWRKSISFGPVRLNFSGSGVGASFGVRGARVSTGPRGTFVHLGSHGFRYTQRIDKPYRAIDQQDIPSAFHPSDNPHSRVVDSTNVEFIKMPDIVDSSSQGLLDEIKRANDRLSLEALCISVAALFGLIGIIVHSAVPRLALASGIIASAALCFLPWARWRDRVLGTVRIHYSFDPVGDQIEEALERMIAAMKQTGAIWSVRSQSHHGDWKRNGGATRSIDRHQIQVGFGLPSMIKTNARVGFIKLSGRTLYFFPDRILVYSGKDVAAIDYDSISFSHDTLRFVEESRLTHDAMVVDNTWAYVNKSGGPDRRFAYNRQIPVVLYGVLRVSASSGINLELHTSSHTVAEGAAKLLGLIGEATKRMKRSQSESQASDTLPSVISFPDEPAPFAWLGPVCIRLLQLAIQLVVATIQIVSLQWIFQLPALFPVVISALSIAVPIGILIVRVTSGSAGISNRLLVWTFLCSFYWIVATVMRSRLSSFQSSSDSNTAVLSEFRTHILREIRSSSARTFRFQDHVEQWALTAAEAELVADDIYRGVFRKAFSDGVISPGERRKLDSLAKSLLLGDSQSQSIESMVRAEQK